jgi:hypothetical protein
MTDAQEDTAKLLKAIRGKRKRIAVYLEELEPRGARLTNRSVVFGGIATLLTAAQLPFGRGSVSFLKTVYPAGGVSVWQLLAVAATICSAIAAIAGAIYKQHEIASRLAKAQGCAVKLEGLETSLDLKLITLKEANARYAQHIAEVPWVPSEGADSSARGKESVDSAKGKITSPEGSALVPRAIPSAGSASDVGSNVHLWLVIEVNGLFWPKEGEIFPDDADCWTAPVFEDGATELFSLSLFAADRNAHKQIVAWLKSGKRTGMYRELSSLPGGMRRVDRVDGLRLIK